MSVHSFTGDTSRVLARNQHSGSDGGGGMDDVLRRLGSVETAVSGAREDLSALKATVPALATKADLTATEASLVKWIVGSALTTIAVAAAVLTLIAKLNGKG